MKSNREKQLIFIMEKLELENSNHISFGWSTDQLIDLSF